MDLWFYIQMLVYLKWSINHFRKTCVLVIPEGMYSKGLVVSLGLINFEVNKPCQFESAKGKVPSHIIYHNIITQYIIV